MVVLESYLLEPIFTNYAWFKLLTTYQLQANPLTDAYAFYIFFATEYITRLSVIKDTLRSVIMDAQRMNRDVVVGVTAMNYSTRVFT